MHVFHQIKERINTCLQTLCESFPEISVEPPKNPSHGDIATNAAMVIAKNLGKKPIEIASELIALFKQDIEISNYVKEFSIAAPGFINMFLNKNVLHAFLSDLNKSGLQTFDSNLNIGKNKKVNIEFASPNPTGPMHIGHARGAIYGDVLCRLFKKCGFEVTAEYYVNDAGSQIDTLVKSLYIRYKQLLGEKIELSNECYPGQYLIDAAQKLQKVFGNDLQMNDAKLRRWAIDEMMFLIRVDLQKLGVKHDVFTSEQSLIERGLVSEAIQILTEKGLIYHGVLEKPKGNADDWEPREQLLFRSTNYGDDADRAIVKSDGTYAYFASDVALHLNKLKRGYDELFLLLGADHIGYVKRISATVQAMSDNNKTVHVLINQLVNILKNDKPIRMSKRKGNFVTVDDVLDEISPDVLRVAMLMQRNNVVIDIDCDKLVEQSKDNPFFYIQYAHTRIASVIRNAYSERVWAENELHYQMKEELNYELLNSESELEIIKYMMQCPRMIELAITHREPHRITYYLYELANRFHSMWNDGIIKSDMRFILKDNIELSHARIGLLCGIATILAIGLEVIGVKPMLKM